MPLCVLLNLVLSCSIHIHHSLFNGFIWPLHDLDSQTSIHHFTWGNTIYHDNRFSCLSIFCHIVSITYPCHRRAPSPPGAPEVGSPWLQVPCVLRLTPAAGATDLLLEGERLELIHPEANFSLRERRFLGPRNGQVDVDLHFFKGTSISSGNSNIHFDHHLGEIRVYRRIPMSGCHRSCYKETTGHNVDNQIDPV